MTTREEAEASHALALEQLDEVTRKLVATKNALELVAQSHREALLQAARWQIRAEKAEAERDEVGVQLAAARERLAKMRLVVDMARTLALDFPRLRSTLAALDEVPGDEGGTRLDDPDLPLNIEIPEAPARVRLLSGAGDVLAEMDLPEGPKGPGDEGVSG